MQFNHTFLRERITTMKDGYYIHNNPDVIPALKRFSPDVVVTDGFNPTQLYAFGYALLKGIPHVPMTDGTYLYEQSYSKLHKLVRRFVFSRSAAFVSASMGGQQLFESYGILPERCFKSHLCIDNDAYMRVPEPLEKRFDFIYSGRMVPHKNPLFAHGVARQVARLLGRRVSILFAGAGSDEERVRAVAAREADAVEAEFHGFAMQGELPSLYRSAKVFLFPTRADVWGVVTNEACAAGLPVIVTPYAGVAGELVLDGENGFICELDTKVWAERAALLLTQQDMWQRFSRRSLSLVREYTFDNAATGLTDACRFALAEEPKKISRPI